MVAVLLLPGRVGAQEQAPAAKETASAADSGAEAAGADEGFLTRRQKVWLLNAGGVAGIIAYGLLNWDYGENSFSFNKEHWFQRDSKEGGMDKLGHFWSSYAFSHGLAWVYRQWDYTPEEANLYGALSSFGLQTAMELADGFSRYGVSYEDLVMNTLGAGAGYLWGRYPFLKNKIDFRVEYVPGFDSDDLDPFTNYQHQKFLVALKAGGFEALRLPVVEYLELRAGYYARNYEDYSRIGNDDRRRVAFAGVGINVTRLLQKFFDITVFDYIQVPYTAITFDFEIDD
jgi:hypothetical protein